MNEMVTIAAAAAVCIAAGIFAGLSIVFVFNRIPASWLCDYGERPSAELTDPNIKRIKENPWRWLFAAGAACMCVRLLLGNGEITLTGIQMTVSGLIASWALGIIALSDRKYMIIPDQFLLVIVVSAIGMARVFRNTESVMGLHGFWQPAAGLLVGGGAMLMIAGIGALAKKEIMGFGDVKLCGAIGLLLGGEGAGAVLIMTALVSGAAAAAGLISGKYKRHDAMPLGPYICACTGLYMFIIWPLTIYN